MKRLIKTTIIKIVVITVLVFVSTGQLTSYQKEQESQYIKNRSDTLASILKGEKRENENIIESFLDPSISHKEKDQVLKENQIEAIELYHGFNSIQIQNIQRKMRVMILLPLYLLIAIEFLMKRKKIKHIIALSDNLNYALNNDYQFNISNYREDELSALENDLYKVINKLKSWQEYSKEAKINLENNLSDISHQLKTPLTSMFVINDILSKEDISLEVRRKFLQKNRKQLIRIQWLVQSILKLSQIDSGTIVFKQEPVNLHQLIDDIIKETSISTEIKNIEIINNLEPYEVILDYDWTKEALLNIINNAINYSYEDSKIEVNGEQTPIFTRLTITDQGEGIAEEHINHIFERFYRANPESDSIGIGLNMSETIINRQQGTIKVESEKNQGTRFTITFY